MPAPPIRLICCPDLDSYARVATRYSRERGEAPVLGRPPLARGFGSAPEFVDASSWTPEAASPGAATPPPDPRRVCVALDEASCRAVAAHLAAATGRELVVVEASNWEPQLEALLAREALASLTFVVPLWSADAPLDPTWLRRVLTFARTHEAALAELPWGIVTGADPSRLSLVAAKTLLQSQIIAAYADTPAIMFAGASAESLDSRLALLSPDHDGAGLRLIDVRQLRDASARKLLRRAASMLYFRAHGRSYCGMEGHLCGARPLNLAPETAIEACIDGLSCANAYDGAYDAKLRAFPRIDPRSYDTPIMVLDSCSAGAWSSPDWALGIPSLAVHALSGAPSGVVSGDYTTATTPISHTEVFAVLYSSSSLGEAVSRLNRARPRAIAELPYYLFGDAELPVGAARWPSWCADPLELACEREAVSQHLRARVPLGHPFARVPLGIRGAHHTTTFVVSADPTLELHTLHLLASDPPELWMALARSQDSSDDDDSSSDSTILDLITVPAPRLPPGLLEAAVTAPLRVSPWTEALAPGAESLLAAALNIERVERLCNQTRGRALRSDPRDFLSCVPAARQVWLQAHRHALDCALTLAPRGLWGPTLWKGENNSGTTVALPCPHCGLSPTLHRDYDSGHALRRRQWECVACMLILDRPLMPLPELSVTMSTTVISPTQPITAKISLDNSAQNTHFAVAGTLLLDRKGHGVPAPPPFAFELEPGERKEMTVELSLDGPPPIAHRYYARALLLINGVWLLTMRYVTVRADRADQPAGHDSAQTTSTDLR